MAPGGGGRGGTHGWRRGFGARHRRIGGRDARAAKRRRVLAERSRGLVVNHLRLFGFGRSRPRTESAVFEDLKRLCRSPGYAHAIAVYWMRGNMLRTAAGTATAEGIAALSEGLTRREIDILVGLVVQGELELALPKPSVTRKHMRKTERLMVELHEVIGDSLAPFLRAGAADFGEALREPIIYGPESRPTSRSIWIWRSTGIRRTTHGCRAIAVFPSRRPSRWRRR